MKINLVLSFLFLCFIIKGQDVGYSSFESLNVNNILQEDKIYTTPEVMTFQKINFLPADLYTGKIKVEIPLYEIKSGNITVPITLSYNAEGIKIDDEAANVGMNWVINAGGNILRIVKDLDDHTMKFNIDYKFDWYGEGDTYLKPIGNYLTHKGYLKEYSDLKQITNFISPFNRYYASEDALPDLFLVNSPSLSSKFHFEKGNSYTKYKPKVIDGSGIKIENVNYNEFSYENVKNYIGFDGETVFGLNSRERNDEMTNYTKNESWKYNKPKDYTDFKITDNKGLVHHFNDYDLIETIPLYIGAEEMPNPYITFFNTAKDFARFNHSLKKSVWHLNSIYDPSTNKQITFTYNTLVSNEVYSKYMYKFKSRIHQNSLSSLNMELGSAQNHIIQTEDISPDFEAVYKWIECPEVIFNKLIQQKKIKEISWDKGKVKFLYNKKRLDKKDENALTDIIISDLKGNRIKHYQFEYSYFVSKELCNTPKCKRLKLIGLNLLNVNTTKIEQKYTFEYDESEPLPKVESLEKDYLGFYNKNGAKIITIKDNWGIEHNYPSKSTMYFCPGKYQYSILPFSLPNSSCLQIKGDQSLAANSYSLLGMLKKITYPTGGSVEFEYENHKFNLLGNEIIAGGARIKKQKIKDDKGKYRIFSYEYKNQNNISSGYINNIPKYGDIRSYLNSEAWCDECYEYDPMDGCTEKCYPAQKELFFYFYDRSKSEIELTKGSFVGYSKIIEKEEGNGFKEYYYSSPSNYPNEKEKLLNKTNEILARNSQYPGIAYTDNDIRRGKLLKEITYNQKNQILQKNEYTYTYKLFDENSFDFRKSFIMSKQPTQSSVVSLEDNFRITLRNERNLVTKKESKEYVDHGLIQSTIEYEYDKRYPLLKKEIKKDPINEVISYYKYPFDFTDSNSIMAQLTWENRISTPVITKVFRKEDGKERPVFQTRTEYTQDKSTQKLILPKYVYSAKGGYSEEKKITYDRYDKSGNLIQYTPENGLPVSIIWGYNDQYPLAKIEGVGYESLISGNAAIKDIITTLQRKSTQYPEDQNTIISLLEQLRINEAMKDAMVTTYTHKPLIGMTSMGLPNGLREYYTYDAMGRLKEIRDQDGKLLKSYEYHFRKN